jgi:hypothetical protein
MKPKHFTRTGWLVWRMQDGQPDFLGVVGTQEAARKHLASPPRPTPAPLSPARPLPASPSISLSGRSDSEQLHHFV